jgi:DNA-binding NarL/FixJ family response regulator
MRVLIADDHTLFRDSLRSLLEARGLEVVGEARNGREACELARRLSPDIVLMDLSMPEVDGLAATRQISAELPAVKVVVLTASDDDAKLFEAIKSGAQGYLLKNLDAEEFFSLLERTERGEPALTPAIARKLLQEFARPQSEPAQRQEAGRDSQARSDPDALTEREREILELLVQGVTSNRRLARQLGVSENTVKFHVRHILDKLHLHNRAQVVGHALRHGMVEPPPPREG